MSFISHPDIPLGINHTGQHPSSVKEKDKKWRHGLALKVLIRFKIELVYSICKPVIWKYNFLNPLNVQRPSRNVKFDSYRDKGNPLFTFNVIKFVLFWHRISGFLFMVTVIGYFLLFYNYNQTQKTTKGQSIRSQKQTLQTSVLGLVFQEMCFLK